MEAKNILFIFSDEQNRDFLGCYGHPLAHTPNLDALAEHGTRFTSAYTNCPICVPARASLATGHYVHQIGYWDNAFPYDGAVPSWHHHLRANGYRVDSIGKLHFRGGDDYGFIQEINPMYVVGGIGDVASSIRDGALKRNSRKGIEEARAGDSTYLVYDRSNTERAVEWLNQHQHDEQPWVLFLSFVCPHPPFVSPEIYYTLFEHRDISLPPQWRFDDWPQHPVIRQFREFFSFDEPFSEEILRRLYIAYLGMCSFVDAQIGHVLTALHDLGLNEKTRIIYSSDHGESLGARGMFGKFTMYEESAAVPLIIAGSDVPSGRMVKTPVSLVDCFPTIVEGLGCKWTGNDLPGSSLWKLASQPDMHRTVFSEYHAIGSRHAAYMMRDLRYKYVYYVDAPSQLFDLKRDPHELRDLASLPEFDSILKDFEMRLRGLLDPEAVDAQALSDQAALVQLRGGREQVIARGSFANSPVPGEKPSFFRPSAT